MLKPISQSAKQPPNNPIPTCRPTCPLDTRQLPGEVILKDGQNCCTNSRSPKASLAAARSKVHASIKCQAQKSQASQWSKMTQLDSRARSHLIFQRGSSRKWVIRRTHSTRKRRTKYCREIRAKERATRGTGNPKLRTHHESTGKTKTVSEWRRDKYPAERRLERIQQKGDQQWQGGKQLRTWKNKKKRDTHPTVWEPKLKTSKTSKYKESPDTINIIQYEGQNHTATVQLPHYVLPSFWTYKRTLQWNATAAFSPTLLHPSMTFLRISWCPCLGEKLSCFFRWSFCGDPPAHQLI